MAEIGLLSEAMSAAAGLGDPGSSERPSSLAPGSSAVDSRAGGSDGSGFTEDGA
jgi:hypothetical protein